MNSLTAKPHMKCQCKTEEARGLYPVSGVGNKGDNPTQLLRSSGWRQVALGALSPNQVSISTGKSCKQNFLPDFTLVYARLIKKHQTTPWPHPPKPTVPAFDKPTFKSLLHQAGCCLSLEREKVGTEVLQLHVSIICTKAKGSLPALADKLKPGPVFLLGSFAGWQLQDSAI